MKREKMPAHERTRLLVSFWSLSIVGEFQDAGLWHVLTLLCAVATLAAYLTSRDE